MIDPSRLQRPKSEMACRLISSGVRVLTVLNLLLRHSYLELLMNNHDILKRKEVETWLSFRYIRCGEWSVENPRPREILVKFHGTRSVIF